MHVVHRLDSKTSVDVSKLIVAPVTTTGNLEQKSTKKDVPARTDPSWQLLYLENPGFAKSLPGSTKLALLREALDDEFEKVAEAIGGIDLAIEAFDIKGFTFEEAGELEHSVDIGGFRITCFCLDADADLEDLEILSEVPLAAALKAYVDDPCQDLQEALRKQDIDHEHNISPRSGYPMLPGGIKIETSSDYWEFEASSTPDDSVLIGKLVNIGEMFLLQDVDADHRESRPLFTKKPEWNEDYSVEGSISVAWNTECFLPAGQDSISKKQRYTKSSISIEETFTGNSVLDDYTIEYTYKTPSDLEDVLVAALEEESVSQILEKPILQLLALQ
jgi:hypothetical protein